jgi:hypothetical protein
MADTGPQTLRKEVNTADNVLHFATREWMAHLPPKSVPEALALQFPRIVNEIARMWNKPVQCDRYLDGLIFSDREQPRQGFPPKICMEIMSLKNLMVDRFEEMKVASDPQTQDMWKDHRED